MKKKILTNFLIFILITACGYKPIYKKNKIASIEVGKIEFLGERKINNRILDFIKIEKNSSNNISQTLILNSTKENIITSKDKTGNPSTYKMTIKTNIILKNNETESINKNFIANFSYSNKENKFELNEYKKTVEENLIKSISEKIVIFLSLEK